MGTVENNASPLGKLLLVPRRTKLATRFYQENFPTYAPPPTLQQALLEPDVAGLRGARLLTVGAHMSSIVSASSPTSRNCV